MFELVCSSLYVIEDIFDGVLIPALLVLESKAVVVEVGLLPRC